MSPPTIVEAYESARAAHHRLDELREDLQAIREDVQSVLQTLARIERGCQLSGERRAASTAGRWGVVIAIVTGLLALLTACVSLWGCSGPEVVSEPAGESTLQLDSTIDLGIATVHLQADAIVDPPVEVSVCAVVSVTALAVLRVSADLAWDMMPTEQWRICVSGFGLRQCVDGP